MIGDGETEINGKLQLIQVAVFRVLEKLPLLAVCGKLPNAPGN